MLEMNIRCKDRAPYQDKIMVQNGWTADGRRHMVEVRSANSKSCMFDNRVSEPGCGGCKWRDSKDPRDL